MNYINIIVVLIASLFSGILGIIISNIYHKRQQLKTLKLNLITNILGYRYQLTAPYIESNKSQEQIITYLNQILVVFNKSDEVINALIAFKSNRNVDNTVTLIKRMCDDVGIKYSKFNDSLLDTPFSPEALK